MAQESATADDEEQDMDSLPPYKNLYEDNERVRENREASGYYGIMYAGEYDWDNQKCTSEAYSSYASDAHPAERRQTINGKPRRSLTFHTEWMDVDEAVSCVQEIGRYGIFDPEGAAWGLRNLPSGTKIVVGRERRPVVYLWTDDAPAAMDVLDQISHQRTAGRGPTELGAFPEADHYPVRFLGENASDVDAGEWMLVRGWWG